MRYCTAQDDISGLATLAPMSITIPGFHAVVPAGGAGTRLWPLSRAGHPKFLLDLTGVGPHAAAGDGRPAAPAPVGGVLVVTGAGTPRRGRQLPELSRSR